LDFGFGAVGGKVQGMGGGLGDGFGFVGHGFGAWAGCLAWNMALSMPDWVI
jgi:hypothetical protein